MERMKIAQVRVSIAQVAEEQGDIQKGAPQAQRKLFSEGWCGLKASVNMGLWCKSVWKASIKMGL